MITACTNVQQRQQSGEQSEKGGVSLSPAAAACEQLASLLVQKVRRSFVTPHPCIVTPAAQSAQCPCTGAEHSSLLRLASLSLAQHSQSTSASISWRDLMQKNPVLKVASLAIPERRLLPNAYDVARRAHHYHCKQKDLWVPSPNLGEMNPTHCLHISGYLTVIYLASPKSATTPKSPKTTTLDHWCLRLMLVSWQ